MSKPIVTVHPNRVYGIRDEKQLTFDHYEPSLPTGAAVLFVNSGGFEAGKLVQYAKAGSTIGFCTETGAPRLM